MCEMMPKYEQDFNNSIGEKNIYESLKKLPDSYVVMHSMYWVRKNPFMEGEADFIILHPKKGIIIVEVKSGGIECDKKQWYQIRCDNKQKIKIEDPMKQATRSKYRILEEIRKILGYYKETNKSIWIQTAVWFPSITK